MASETAIDGPVRIGDRATGVFLVGEFVGFKDQKPRTVNEGTPAERTYQGYDVGIRLETGAIETVGYPSREDARLALRGVNLGQLVMVATDARHGVTNGRGWLMWNATGVTVDASAFSI